MRIGVFNGANDIALTVGNDPLKGIRSYKFNVNINWIVENNLVTNPHIGCEGKRVKIIFGRCWRERASTKQSDCYSKLCTLHINLWVTWRI